MCQRTILLRGRSVSLLLLVFAGPLWMTSASRAAEPLRRTTVAFKHAPTEARVPEIFRLDEHSFTAEQKFKDSVSDDPVISELTFPSPLSTAVDANNTVHCEYFRPKLAAGEKAPGVVVLHILGGDFDLARAFCHNLASHQVCALFLKMPYYGPRRDPQSPARMVSADLDETRRGMHQAVLDIRRAAAWLSAQEEIDASRLGIMGVSLGGIVSALAAEAEPKFKRVALLLAGGDVGNIPWNSPELARLAKKWKLQAIKPEDAGRILRPVDPVTYAELLRDREVIMMNAKHDEVIPPACTEALWKAAGEPPIEWWDAGHYTAAKYIIVAMNRTGKFFAAPPGEVKSAAPAAE